MLFSFALGMPGPMELIIIFAIMLLLFGNRLPNIARNMGRSLLSFKAGVKEIQDEIKETSDEAESAATDAAKGLAS